MVDKVNASSYSYFFFVMLFFCHMSETRWLSICITGQSVNGNSWSCSRVEANCSKSYNCIRLHSYILAQYFMLNCLISCTKSVSGRLEVSMVSICSWDYVIFRVVFIAFFTVTQGIYITCLTHKYPNTLCICLLALVCEAYLEWPHKCVGSIFYVC